MSQQQQLPKGATLDEKGNIVMPATRRPDGTWRKPVVIRAGFKAQEEAQIYESKGKAIQREREEIGCVGAVYVDQPNPKPKKESRPAAAAGGGGGGSAASAAAAAKKKEEKAIAAAAAELDDLSLQDLDSAEIAKRLRALRKKLRQIEELQKIPTLDQSQKEKLATAPKIKAQIRQLEKLAPAGEEGAE